MAGRFVLILLAAFLLNSGASQAQNEELPPYDGLECVQMVGDVNLPEEGAITVLVLRARTGAPLIGMYFRTGERENRVYLDRDRWQKLVRLYDNSVKNWETVDKREFESLGRISGFRVGKSQAMLQLTLLGETDLEEKRVLMTTESARYRFVLALGRKPLGELTDRLEEAERVVEREFPVR